MLFGSFCEVMLRNVPQEWRPQVMHYSESWLPQRLLVVLRKLQVFPPKCARPARQGGIPWQERSKKGQRCSEVG